MKTSNVVYIREDVANIDAQSKRQASAVLTVGAPVTSGALIVLAFFVLPPPDAKNGLWLLMLGLMVVTGVAVAILLSSRPSDFGQPKSTIASCMDPDALAMEMQETCALLDQVSEHLQHEPELQRRVVLHRNRMRVLLLED